MNNMCKTTLLRKLIVCYIFRPSYASVRKHSVFNIVRSTSLASFTRSLCISSMEMNSIVIDVRSDTVTKPTQGMRKAISEAVVGDDVYKEDPTVNELEQRMAAMLGKEAALLVPSGTMGNLIAVMVHCDKRGAEVLVGDKSHIFYHEQGGISQIGGVHPRTLTTNPDGTYDMQEIVQKIRSDKIHEPITSLICIENTHNKCGGKVLPISYLDQLGALKQQIQIPIHLDGARLFNASTYLKVTPAELTKYADSVCVCLSKGLGAPIGSVLAGTAKFISKSLRIRKALGGGMRQAGIIAGAGLYALDNMMSRLEEDHQHTRMIAEAVNNFAPDKVSVDLENLHTNILMMNLSPQFMNSERFRQRLLQVTDKEKEELQSSMIVKMYPFEMYQIRAVLHADISRSDVDNIIKKLTYVLKEPPKVKK